jgi:hypothetical protein
MTETTLKRGVQRTQPLQGIPQPTRERAATAPGEGTGQEYLTRWKP